MKINCSRAARVLALLCLVNHSSQSVIAASLAGRVESAPPNMRTVEIVHTNWLIKHVTNLIEVRVPQNVFVTEYRTNLFRHTVTNTLAVDVFRTNFVVRYETNWITRTLTNQTILALTNWETVVVTRTNWIRQPMTNIIEISVPVNAVAVAKSDPPQTEATRVAANDALVLEVVRTATPSQNNQVEVQFKVRLAEDSAIPLQVQQWRVEREDGAVFFFAQEQEFKRVLPTGRYQVHVKARRDADSPLISVKGNLAVTQDAVARR